MSDFDGRLTEVLRSESESAPDALGLADAARGRARARRRTRIAALGVAVVAALAVPAAVVALGNGDDGGSGPIAGEDAEPDTFPGRWETWRGVSVRVPEGWKYGDLATYCADGGTAESFLVGRPGFVNMILCTPGSSWGVSFQETDMGAEDEPFDWPVDLQADGEAWPDGTYVGAHGEAGVLVTVAGPDRDEVAAVLDTVTSSEPVDPNGCSVEDDGGPGMAGAGEVPVCRYDETGRLVQSEKLTGADAEAAIAAVRAAPESGGVLKCKNPASEYVVMGVEGDRAEAQYAGQLNCGDQGLFIDGVRHELSTDVLYWALSPGWTGAVGAHVTLPDPLRQ